MLVLLQVDGNDDVGTHLPRHIHRQVVERATIDKHVLSYLHRLEDSRDGHAGPHATVETSTVGREDDLPEVAMRHISGHTAERNTTHTLHAACHRTGAHHRIEQHQHLGALENPRQGVGLSRMSSPYRKSKDILHSISITCEELTAETVVTVGEQRFPLLRLEHPLYIR